MKNEKLITFISLIKASIAFPQFKKYDPFYKYHELNLDNVDMSELLSNMKSTKSMASILIPNNTEELHSFKSYCRIIGGCKGCLYSDLCNAESVFGQLLRAKFNASYPEEIDDYYFLNIKKQQKENKMENEEIAIFLTLIKASVKFPQIEKYKPFWKYSQMKLEDINIEEIIEAIEEYEDMIQLLVPENNEELHVIKSYCNTFNSCEKCIYSYVCNTGTRFGNALEDKFGTDFIEEINDDYFV